MKVDLYTKVILTIIAVSLSVIALHMVDFVPHAKAQTQTAPARPAKPMDVNIVSVNGIKIDSCGVLKVAIDEPLNLNSPIEVTGQVNALFPNYPIDVTINGIYEFAENTGALRVYVQNK